MTQQEFGNLVKGMKAVYTDPKFIPDNWAMEVWFSMLKDILYEVASVSVQTYMMTNKFPPTIADIREHAMKNTTEEQMSPNLAWSLVYKAICNSSYNSVKEFEKLPEIVQKVVGSPSALESLARSDGFNEEVEKSLFVKQYNAMITREQENAKLPQSIKDRLGVNDIVKIEG